MKYFEISEPYYALLKANNKEDATKKYIENVADIKGETFEINEVSRDYALAKFAQMPGENKKLIPVGEIVNEVLIIDGALI